MAGISTQVEIVDRVSGSLNRITASLYNTTSAFGAVDKASDVAFNPSGIQAMSNELYGYNSRIQQLEADLVGANRKIEEMEEQTKKAAQSADMLKNAFSLVKGIMATIGVQKLFQTSDALVQTESRLNMMNDGMQTTDELMNMVYRSAQNARGSFDAMADVVARFGNNAKDAFGSNAEVVAFAELVQKQMTIAGASTAEASNAMLQLSQGLGSGVLRGDELNSIFEQAPNLIRNIADYLNVPIGEIRNMATEGQLTADIVKASIFAASDEINANFAQMPMTWGQVWQSMQNTALMKFKPVLNEINKLANSGALQSFVSGVASAMAKVANIVVKIFGLVASVANTIKKNWSIISPVIYGIATALALYGGYLAITKGLEIASAASKVIMTVQTWATTSATWSAAAAQNGLNSAMLASPITWIIALIAALIVVIVKLCNWIAETTGIAQSGIGVITGALAVAVAFICNLFITLWNILAEIISVIWNLFATLANFIGNLFTNPVAAIVGLFVGLGDAVLGIVEGILEALSWITFGLADFTDEISAVRDSMNSWYDDSFETTTFVERLDADALKADTIGYGEAFDSGAAWGDGLMANLDDFLSVEEGDLFESDENAALLNNIDFNTSEIADSINISNENLKYLRDMAEQEVVNRFTTAEIKVDMTNNNNISNSMDIDGIVEQLTIGVQEAMTVAAEGV